MKNDSTKIKSLLLIIGFVAASFIAATPIIQDDAVITYRYVLNLVNGHGLVPYIGGAPVEGYSNAVLLFSTALFSFIFGLHSIESIMLIGTTINKISLLIIILLLMSWNKQEQRIYDWFPSLLLILFFAFIWAPTTGLETSYYTVLVFIMVYCFVRDNTRIALLVAVLVSLSRPDGLLIAGICVLVFIARTNPRHTLRSRFFNTSLYFILPLFTLLGLRFWYFGLLIPNSGVAKSHITQRGVLDGQGLSYLWRAMTETPVVGLLLVITLVYLVWNARSHVFETSVIFTQLAFVLAVGGDELYFGPHRFIYPIFPFLFRTPVLMYASVNRIKKRWLFEGSLGLLILCTLVFYHPIEKKWTFHWLHELKVLKKHTPKLLQQQAHALLHCTPWIDYAAGDSLSLMVPKSTQTQLSLGSFQGGAFPLAWKGRFVDFYGLLSPVYARAAWEARESLFLTDPVDIVAVYRFPGLKRNQWVSSECHFPFVRTLKLLNYQPRALITLQAQLLDWHSLLMADGEWSFLFFTKDASLLDITKIQWNSAMPVRYEDETGVLEGVVPMKRIVFNTLGTIIQ